MEAWFGGDNALVPPVGAMEEHRICRSRRRDILRRYRSGTPGRWKRAARSRSGKADLILGQGRHVAKTPLMVDGGGSIVMDVGRQDITEITGHDGGRGM